MDLASHRLRQGTYRVLGAGFAPPDPQFLGVAADSADVLDEFGLYDYSYGPQLGEMLHAFGAADLGELTREHQRLFETGPADVVCDPRESIRRGDLRTGETAQLLAELRAIQESFGVTVPADRIDHASTELAAMATLCGRITATGDDAEGADLLRRQAAFAVDHVLRWIPALGRDVAERARHPALRSLGTAAVAFLEHERQHIPILMADTQVAGA